MPTVATMVSVVGGELIVEWVQLPLTKSMICRLYIYHVIAHDLFSTVEARPKNLKHEDSSLSTL